MNPLSIEELKALPVGDWVWFVQKIGKTEARYGQILAKHPDTVYLCTPDELIRVYWETCGKTWAAYKNKEQAETKGEIVELPCKVGNDIYMVEQVNDKEWEILHGKVKSFAISENNNVEIYACYDCGLTFWHCNGDKFYLNKTEAENRLAELKGGNNGG